MSEARQAAQQAAKDLERERLAERMRAAAEAMRKPGAPGAQGAEGREMARALDRVAERLGRGRRHRGSRNRAAVGAAVAHAGAARSA